MPGGVPDHRLRQLGDEVRARLEAVHHAREEGLAACRATIQASGRAIRAVHRQDQGGYRDLVARAEASLRRGQAAVTPYPAVAGFLHDAEKEYAEARLTEVLVGGAGTEDERHGGLSMLPGPDVLGVGVPAWLNGLAEAASELRRYLLDRLREGQLVRGESLLATMEEVYDLLTTIDYPDAVTGGLRRTTDALRAVLERSRADLTMTLVQARLQAALDRGMDAGPGGHG